MSYRTFQFHLLSRPDSRIEKNKEVAFIGQSVSRLHKIRNIQKEKSLCSTSCTSRASFFFGYMGVSKKRGGPPRSSILIGFSIIFTIHFGATHIMDIQTLSCQDHPDAWSLLAQQAERHGAARRELLDCCNQDSLDFGRKIRGSLRLSLLNL